MFLVAYDVTNEQSFNACNKWYERCRAQKPNQTLTGKPIRAVFLLVFTTVNLLDPYSFIAMRALMMRAFGTCMRELMQAQAKTINHRFMLNISKENFICSRFLRTDKCFLNFQIL